ncbi:MAG: hypothetical protein ABH840_04125 [Nanoarchaeota archaeon]
MARLKAWKFGVGVGAVLLGAYISLSSLSNILAVIVGIVIAAFGIGLIAAS